MDNLKYLSEDQFKKILDLDISRHQLSGIFSTMCRINTLYMIMQAGSGHIGSSFSSIDIVAWLYLNELRPGRVSDGSRYQDIYFSSKGHDAPAIYAVMIALGMLPFSLLHKLRKLGGLPGHPDIDTPGIVANTGSLGMGISKAKGLILANRTQQKNCRIYVMTGDGELQEGQLWESLVSAANREMDELTVFVDHNKIQSDIWVSQTSDLGDIENKFASFGWHVQKIDGHNFAEIERALDLAHGVKGKPKVIIADTVKGNGVSFMAHDAGPDKHSLYKFHSGAPTNEHYFAALKELTELLENQLAGTGFNEGMNYAQQPLSTRIIPSDPQRLIAAYADELVNQGEKRHDLVVLDADLKLDCGLIPFEETFPHRFFECGIAEQDMVSQAGGMARNGLLPVVHSFACFLSTRANEQIYNNATEKTRIIYVGSLAGLLPAGPGHSHQSVRDISCLAAVPGLQLLQPSCETETKMVLDYCINRSEKSSYIRLVSIPCEITFQLPADYTLTPGKGVPLTKGKDAVIFTYGPVLLEQAFRAARKLKAEHDFNVTVMNLPWLNCIDQEWLEDSLAGIPAVFTLDDHYITGGQGQMLAAAIANSKIASKPSIFMCGIEDIPACGTNHEALKNHNLDETSIIDFIVRGLGNN